ncbi:polyphosphate polymerase domain-containing protein [Spiractinospora alimapuensis]|uniref:polyphosphate polymerase domain-containing protein n=1 Tax=Spiractinospora alimapuensis TaxID=2820884 RepID=UPI001F282493|nr:polyphosphate polymerase domain-containing protein [Spiractinospora alimapuensis]QVQ51721.1 polyphosphate polymerase domain-containing protein [Spiractinospora alimapuensis]
MSRRVPSLSLDTLPGVGLEEINDRAGLQTRVDTKYLIAPATHAHLLSALAQRPEWACLAIDGQRHFRYGSTYFDTPSLLTYHQHRQGRRRRFKIRTRAYLDTGDCSFEVKLRGARESTVKRRMSYAMDDADRLTARAQEFVAEVLDAAYGVEVPEHLAARARTEYRRHTLIDRAAGTRVTCDTALVCSSGDRRVAAGPMVVVETKATKPGNPVDRLMRSLGAHPIRLSKYCVATAVLNPDVPANPWARVLREWFGPTAATPAVWRVPEAA